MWNFDCEKKSFVCTGDSGDISQYDNVIFVKNTCITKEENSAWVGIITENKFIEENLLGNLSCTEQLTTVSQVRVITTKHNNNFVRFFPLKVYMQ